MEQFKTGLLDNGFKRPYDAELEWLGGANCYCPLNVDVQPDVGFEIVVERIGNDTTDAVAFGARGGNGSGNERWFVGGFKNGSAKTWYFGYVVRYDYGQLKTNEVVKLDLNFRNSREARFNDQLVAVLNSTSGAEGIMINFPAYTLATVYTNHSVYYRYHSFKLSKGQNILYDIIPVRIDGIGHFYDKISKTVLSEVGTEHFIMGPDKR